jgi:nucleotidyltransferase/DNA polymerase involved in DNA repair
LYRVIAHIDMDAFYSSVEQRENPTLRGKPVIVGADPKEGKGRGIVATCSYEARKHGVHSAQPISQAWRLCPHGIYLPPDMAKYARTSGRVMAILLDFSDLVEQIVDAVKALPDSARVLLLAPLIKGRKGEYREVLADLRKSGYARVRVDGKVLDLADDIALDKVTVFEANFHRFMEANHPEIGKAIAEKKDMTPEIDEAMKKAIAEFKQGLTL